MYWPWTSLNDLQSRWWHFKVHSNISVKIGTSSHSSLQRYGLDKSAWTSRQTGNLERGRGYKGAIAYYLDKNWHILNIFSVPFCERCQQLKPSAVWIHIDRHTTAISRGSLVSVLTWVKSLGGQLIPIWGLKFKLGTCREFD